MSEPLAGLLAHMQKLTQESSENVQPWHSFWQHRPTKNFPPRAIRDPEQWHEQGAGGERLSLACTQTDLSATEQKKLIRRWCELLPTLKDVRFLWFHSRVSPELFKAACQMPALEGLYVKWSGITDFTPITQRAGSLRYLHIGSSPSLAPLEVLGELPLLEWLELENVRAAANLEFVSPLKNLRGLGLHGDTNSLKSLKVKSLAPLAGLDKLTWLSMAALRSEDESLGPLATLPSLRYLLINNHFPWQEYAKLAGLRPDIDCDRFTPVSEPVEWTSCKKCKQKTMVMLTGKGMPMLCLGCDSKNIDSLRSNFHKEVLASENINI
ncbi:MAG: hypothetical protein ACRERR_15090 [Moraxellaceae bacterium]